MSTLELIEMLAAKAKGRTAGIATVVLDVNMKPVNITSLRLIAVGRMIVDYGSFKNGGRYILLDIVNVPLHCYVCEDVLVIH